MKQNMRGKKPEKANKLTNIYIYIYVYYTLP